MPKTLLSIVNINGSICSAELHCDSETEYDRVAASILSMMDQDETFAGKVLQYASLYVINRRKVAELNKASMRSADIKTKN